MKILLIITLLFAFASNASAAWSLVVTNGQAFAQFTPTVHPDPVIEYVRLTSANGVNPGDPAQEIRISCFHYYETRAEDAVNGRLEISQTTRGDVIVTKADRAAELGVSVGDYDTTLFTPAQIRTANINVAIAKFQALYAARTVTQKTGP